MIKIVTDSTADLSKEMIEQLEISVAPLQILMSGETYLDGVDISNDEFITRMEASDELPKSSQPQVGSLLDLYDQLGEDGSEILSIHVTDSLSGTYDSACSVAAMTDSKVTVHNSKYVSQALGFQVREAASMARKGIKVEEIIARLEEIRANTSLYIVVDKLDNLVKGGRIGKGSAFLGSLFNIKPIASLANGEYTPVAKARNYKQALKIIATKFAEDVKGKTVKYVGISHANAIDHAQQLCEAMKEFVDKENIIIYTTTPVISTHTGSGALALMFVAE